MTSTSNGTVPHGMPTLDQMMSPDQMMEAVTRGQKAVTDALTSWAELAGSAFSGADDATRPTATGSPLGAMPSVGEIVDRTFDTGVAVLEMQRSLAHQVLESLRVR